MRTVIYEVPAMESLELAAAEMLALAAEEQTKTPYDPVQVAAVFNGVAIGADSTSTAAEVVKTWYDRRHEWDLRDERCRPVVDAINYLLGTLSPEDRSHAEGGMAMRREESRLEDPRRAYVNACSRGCALRLKRGS